MSNKKLRRLNGSETGGNTSPENSSRDALIKILNNLFNNNTNTSIKKPKSIKKFRKG
ncbi:hypothetical protein [Peribacillus muralis]|uniref:hypothetical protein n=1 Tax=Peribacillus muralis TaxID=264697 RepID=UPI000ADC1455